MFINLFHALRRGGVPVTFDEWLLLQEALSENLTDSSLIRFYHLARAILVKSEAHFDKYDRAFLECFAHLESTEELAKIVEAEMLRLPPPELTEEEKDLAASRGGPVGLPELLEIERAEAGFMEQLRKRSFQHHEEGGRAIGMRGRSTQGARGFNAAGVGVGQDSGRLRSAVKIAERRQFENYRDDLQLDTRSMKMALTYLRQVVREGPKDELDLHGTIDATCRNAGELEFVWQRKKKKKIKLMLLMDAGGTMTPHADIVSRLFSAAKDIVRDVKPYYFHNCVYQDLYTDIARHRTVPAGKILAGTDRDYKVIFVGDAYMAPSELFSPNGSIDYWYRNDRPGIEWLMEIRKRFRKAIWLNPEPKRWWDSVPTTQAIRRIFPMYELTLKGVRAGTRALMKT
jgi:uncharacterized protein